MINILIACDNVDAQLGQYLNACLSDLEDHLELVENKNLIHIKGDDCNEGQIEIHTSGFDGARFIFVGFSHGRIDSLIAARVPFINFENAIRFQNSFFYTCACLSAVELGPRLRDSGCLSYMGYKDVVNVPNDFEEVFKRCKTSGIKYFLSGDRTIGESFLYMKKVYDDEYKLLSAQQEGSFLAAAFLWGNMNSLVCLGDDALTLNDFRLQ